MGEATAAATGEGPGRPVLWSTRKVFAWLAALTLVEVGLVYLPMPRVVLGSLLVGGSLVKASMVALHFMHLRIEKRLVLWMLLISAVLAAIFVLGLVPDMVFGPGAGARNG